MATEVEAAALTKLLVRSVSYGAALAQEQRSR